tara:strand:+ start:458 stop:718 length:261 start_codon:yes stop_codon:yes gene_type:complete
MKKKKVLTHNFNGKRYNIIFNKFDGATDIDSSPRDMLIAAEPNTQNELITIIHESMHASEWNKQEKIINRTSKDIGRLLWRLGYRK